MMGGGWQQLKEEEKNNEKRTIMVIRGLCFLKSGLCIAEADLLS